MKKLYRSNTKLQIKYLQDIQQILLKQGYKYVSDDGGHIDIISKAITIIDRLEHIEPSENIPKSAHFQVNDKWIDLARDEVFTFNARGDEYICSTSEALIKCNGIKRMFDGFEVPYYFRGEQNFGWDLTSKLGRTEKVDWTDLDPHNVTKIELNYMEYFQNRVAEDLELRTMVFGDSEILDKDDAGWWSLMQHYDEEYGTRMIDVTTSIFSALYFACANWDGSVDSSIDGKLYMFPRPPGRGETITPERHKGILIGVDDESKSNLKDYFNIEAHTEIPRLRKSPTRNDRALAQDGLFVWQAKFDMPLSTFQIFPFRIHRDFKESILKELSSMGYTKERILS